MKFLLTLLSGLFIIGYSFAQPDTDFTASPLEVCVGEEVQFTDLSTSTGTITSWTWDFGDGATSSDQNPTHVYTTAGTINVTLTAEDENGAVSEVKPGFIIVNPLPNPSFNPSLVGGCSLPSDVSINNVQPSTGVSYDWDFGNGSTSTSGSPGNVTYNAEGSFDITLTVVDDATGCENTVIQTVDIFDYQADFSVSTATACVGTALDFTDESSPGTDGWSWDFGDGSNSSNQNPSHSYGAAGTYTVTLTATNSVNGCSDTFSEEIEVFPLPTPSFDFSPGSGCAPLDVDFTNTSSGGGTFEWDFGDGNTFSGQNPPSNTYTSNGSYSVTLTQTDANGCSNSVTQSNIINVSSITADFEADIVEGCEVLDVVFTDLSNSPNPDDPITIWEWDFGNGSVFNGQNPPSQSFGEGVYDITLTVTTDDGCSQTVTLSEYINVGIPPNVDFSWDPPQDCAKSEFEFTNLTTIPVPHDPSEVEYEWDFGDGGTSTDENPTYEYPQDTGYFDVQLIVLFRGCPDTIVYEDAVYIDAPIALFDVQSVFCNPTIPLDVTFNDNAIIGEETDNAEMIWDCGDTTFTYYDDPDCDDADQGAASHDYDDYGTYMIQQVIHNYTTGCSDSSTVFLVISVLEANISYLNDSICFGDKMVFSDSSLFTHCVVYEMVMDYFLD